jgi:hypothetical protein
MSPRSCSGPCARTGTDADRTTGRAMRSPAFNSPRRGQEAGWMFWFMRKKLPGSYFALISCSRRWPVLADAEGAGRGSAGAYALAAAEALAGLRRAYAALLRRRLFPVAAPRLLARQGVGEAVPPDADPERRGFVPHRPQGSAEPLGNYVRRFARICEPPEHLDLVQCPGLAGAGGSGSGHPPDFGASIGTGKAGRARCGSRAPQCCRGV